MEFPDELDALWRADTDVNYERFPSAPTQINNEL